MTPHNDREVDSSKVYSTCMTWEIIDVVAQYLGSREVTYCTQNSIRCLAMKHGILLDCAQCSCPNTLTALFTYK